MISSILLLSFMYFYILKDSNSYHYRPLHASLQFIKKLPNSYSTQNNLKNDHIFQIKSNIFTFIKSLGKSPDDRIIYNELLKDSAETGESKVAEAVILQMNMQDVTFNKQTYEYFIKSYLHNKNETLLSVVNEVEAVFKELLRSGYSPSISICTDVIRALGEANLPERAEQMFNKISLLDTLDMDNVEIYNALLSVWVIQCENRPDALAKTEEILQRMYYIELNPNIYTFEYILQGLYLNKVRKHSNNSMNSVKRAYGLYQSLMMNKVIDDTMEQHHSNATSAAAIIKIYEYIYQLCALESSHSLSLCKAVTLHLSDDMMKRNIQMSLDCYKSILKVYIQDYTNEFSAKKVYEICNIISNNAPEYLKNDVDLLMDLALFWACYSNSKKNPTIHDAPFRALEAIVNIHSLNLTASLAPVECYIHLIRALGRENSMQNVEKYIINYFVNHASSGLDYFKIVADIRIWNEVIYQYYRNFDKSISLISQTPAETAAFQINQVTDSDDMYQQYLNARNYNTTKKGKSGNNSYPSANTVLQSLMSKDFTVLTNNSHQLLQLAFNRQETARMQLILNIENILKHMKTLQIAADSETNSILALVYIKIDDFTSIQKLIIEMKLQNQSIPQVVYKSYILQLLKEISKIQKYSTSTESNESKIKLLINYFVEMCEDYIIQANKNSIDPTEPAKHYRVDMFHLEQTYKEIISSSISTMRDLDLRVIFHSYLNALAANTITSNSPRLSIPISIIRDSIEEETMQGLKYDQEISKPSHTPATTSKGNTMLENELIAMAPTSLSNSIADQAIAVLQDMSKYNLNNGGGLCDPTTESYGLLLKAMAKDVDFRRHTIPDRALEIVQYMIASGLTPTDDIFETLIRIWVDSKRPDAARVVESIYKTFRSMKTIKKDNSSIDDALDGNIFPIDLKSMQIFNIYLLLIEVWAKSNLPNSGRKAEDILDNLILSGFKPTAQAFSLIARAWSKFVAPVVTNVSQDALIESVIPPKINSPTSIAISSRKKILRNRNRIYFENSLIVEQERSALNIGSETTFKVQVDQIESCLTRCMAHNLIPEPSLYRSLFTAWSKEGSEASISKMEAVFEHISFATDDGINDVDASTGMKKKYIPSRLSNLFLIPTALIDGINCSSLHPSMYTALASAWSNPIEDAHKFLNHLKRAGALGQQLYIAYNLVLAAYSLHSNSDLNVIIAEKFYKESNFNTSNYSVRLDITATNYLLDCIINSNLKENIVYEKCTEILEYSNKVLQSHPNDYTVYLMLRCWKDRDCKDIYEKASLLFDSMKTNPDGSNFLIHRNSLIYFIEILGSKYPKISTKLLNYLLSINIIPSSNVFSIVLFGAAQNKLLDFAIEVFNQMLKFGYKPEFYSCRALISALAFNGAGADPTFDAERIDQVFTKMLNSGIRATEDMLSLVLQSWSYSRSPFSSYRATEIFRKAMKSSLNYPPPVRIYNILMNIHGKAQLNNPNLSPQIAENILLVEMKEAGVEPDTVSYNTVISAWGRSPLPNASIRAFNLFSIAKASNLKLNVISYSSLLSTLNKASTESVDIILENNPFFLPPQKQNQQLDKEKNDTASYECEEDNISNKIIIAEYIFNEMQFFGIVPDKMAWNIRIGIWCNNYNSNKEENVQNIFERMLSSGCEATTVTYTTLLTMWANSKRPEASGRIVEIFKRMQQEGQKNDAISYSSLLSAIGKTMDPQAPWKASAVFDAMLNSGIKADTTAWTILIGIWSRSKLKNKEEKILEFYALMRKEPGTYSKPNSVTYTSMLEMWARSKHSNASLYILELFEDIMNENIFLDGYAFSKLIPALQKAYKNKNIDHTFIQEVNNNSNNNSYRNHQHHHNSASSLALDKAEQVLMHMVNYKLYPDVLAWNSLMKSDTSFDNDIRILRLYSVMNSIGISLDKFTYEMVLYALGKNMQKCFDDQLKQMRIIKVSQMILQKMYHERMLVSIKSLNSVLFCIARSSVPDAIEQTNHIYKQYIQDSSNNLIPDNFTTKAIMRSYIQNYFYNHTMESINCLHSIEAVLADILHRNYFLTPPPTTTTLLTVAVVDNDILNDDDIPNNLFDVSLLNDLLILWKRSTSAIGHKSVLSLSQLQLDHFEYVLLHIDQLLKYCTDNKKEDNLFEDDEVISSPLISIFKNNPNVFKKIKFDIKTYELYFELCLKYLQIIVSVTKHREKYMISKLNLSQWIISLNHRIRQFSDYSVNKTKIDSFQKLSILYNASADVRVHSLVEQVTKVIKLFE